MKKTVFIMLILFIISPIVICKEVKKDINTGEVKTKTTEAMRLFLMNAQGLLPQIVQGIKEIDDQKETENNQNNKQKNNLKKWGVQQQSIIPPN